MAALLDILLQTLSSLRAHGLRFALTALGIFWGAMMLTYLSASTEGFEGAFREQLARTGPKTVWAFPGAAIKDRTGERGARRIVLEPEDVDRLEMLDVLELTSPETTMWNLVVRTGRRTRLMTVQGVDADVAEIRAFEPAQGRFFNRIEVARSARVAFVGADTAEQLFGRAEAVGAKIRIDGIPFHIVGVAKKKGDQLINMGERDDRLVLVPHSTAFRWLARNEAIERFIAAPRTREQSPEAMAAIRSVTALHHDFAPNSELALNFVNVQEIWSILDVLFGGLQVFLVGTGLVTLLVGAVGVMNIMLVIVNERIAEIGLRKAVGAPDRAIFGLFLAEAVTVSTLAGAAGSLSGFGLIALTRRAMEGQTVASQPVFDPQTSATVVAALVLVGIVAGLLPAIRASRVPPAESLRAA